MVDYNYVYTFLTIAVITAIVIGLAILVPLAGLKRHVSYIQSNPFYFTLELLLVGVLPAVIFFLFIETRGMSHDTAMTLFWGVCIKLTLVHILLEISGYYEHCFGT